MEAVESYRERAPRLRLAALIAVVVVVVGLIAFAVLTADRTVTAIGTTVPSGHLCLDVDQRPWTSIGTVVPADVATVTLEGRWTTSGSDAAQLTTPAGQVIDLRPVEVLVPQPSPDVDVVVDPSGCGAS